MLLSLVQLETPAAETMAGHHQSLSGSVASARPLPSVLAGQTRKIAHHRPRRSLKVQWR